MVELGDGWWAADAVTETLVRTSLGALRVGDPVNLERPLRLSDRLGGHLVQGHVDGVGELVDRTPLPDGSTRMRFRLPAHLARYIVEKGSITVDGISLTVAAVHDDGFDVAVIPHTLAVTNLGAKQPGDPVNLEVDVLAKYVERLLGPGRPASMEAGDRTFRPRANPREKARHDVRSHRERDRGDRPR